MALMQKARCLSLSLSLVGECVSKIKVCVLKTVRTQPGFNKCTLKVQQKVSITLAKHLAFEFNYRLGKKVVTARIRKKTTFSLKMPSMYYSVYSDNPPTLPLLHNSSLKRKEKVNYMHA